SVGLGVKELERAEALYAAEAAYLILDVAHGAQMQVVQQYKQLKELLPSVNLIVGNFATYNSIQTFSQHLGYKPDMVKIGIGPGSACTTRVKTGVGYPQLTALLDCGRMGIPMIADGGCREIGDIAKALACKHVEMVMIGGMLAGTDETPGEVIFESVRPWSIETQLLAQLVPPQNIPMDGGIEKFKKYRGSASKESYTDQGKDASHRTAEGESFVIPYKGPVAQVLQDIEGGLRSAFTYVGAKNLTEFQNNAEFIKITNSGLMESGAHGKRVE
ncbi:MAG TPA: IMP dehydrogenase, partial [Bacteroidia bacterium]|nr:IMP dehydrogenase [Bacteroidia bacterium]